MRYATKSVPLGIQVLDDESTQNIKGGVQYYASAYLSVGAPRTSSGVSFGDVVVAKQMDSTHVSLVN